MRSEAPQIRQATRDALEALDLLNRACDTHRTVDAATPNGGTYGGPEFDEAFDSVGGWDLNAVLEEIRSIADTFDHGWADRVSQLDRTGIESRLRA